MTLRTSAVTVPDACVAYIYSMITRSAQDNDIPAIIELLKLSLGEDRMPKTEAFWRWKHVDNPFGRSPVLLAFEGDELIGVRAFMRWEWRKDTKVYKAVRAVDTATHPSHQGKGIFRKLTMDLVDQCKAEGVDFIYNTPNSKSRPGYLKMGWRSVGRLRIGARPIMSSGLASNDFQDTYAWRDPAVSFSANSMGKMVTNVSTSYFSWRYGSNPAIRYHRLAGESGTYALFFRLKPYLLGTEFRVCDFVVKEEGAWKSLRGHLLRAAGDSGANLITWTSSQASISWLPSLPLGPMVTVRPLQAEGPDFSFNAWSPSIGDLEVF